MDSPSPKSRPERQCLGCRQRRPKEEMVRLVLTPQGMAWDYRGKLPGRGAYLCPVPACVRDGMKALGRKSGRRAPWGRGHGPLRGVRRPPLSPLLTKEGMGEVGIQKSEMQNVIVPPWEEMVERLRERVLEQMVRLIQMARKAGLLVAGSTAVEEACRMRQTALLLWAADAPPSRRNLPRGWEGPQRQLSFRQPELGALIGWALCKVIAIRDRSLAGALIRECDRLAALAGNP
ncbi:MAG: DUF448 domain-containing protein [Nitrospirae bacterium]|nr:DUF448 domain-containing protein [Nitrospirota bacterium]